MGWKAFRRSFPIFASPSRTSRTRLLGLARGEACDAAAANDALRKLSLGMIDLCVNEPEQSKRIPWLRRPAPGGVGELFLARCDGVPGPLRLSSDALDVMSEKAGSLEDVEAAIRALFEKGPPTITDPRHEQRYEQLLAWSAVCLCRGRRSLAQSACSLAEHLRSDPSPAEAWALRARIVRRGLRRAADPYVDALFALWSIDRAIECREPQAKEGVTAAIADLQRFYRERAALRVEIFLLYHQVADLIATQDRARQNAQRNHDGAYWTVVRPEILDEDLLGEESLRRAMSDCRAVLATPSLPPDALTRAATYQLMLTLALGWGNCLRVAVPQDWLAGTDRWFVGLLDALQELRAKWGLCDPSDMPRSPQAMALFGVCSGRGGADALEQLFATDSPAQAFTAIARVDPLELDQMFIAILHWAYRAMGEGAEARAAG